MLEVDDSPDEDLMAHFEKCIEFIRKDGGKVLVHCVSGISRSGAITIAYVMKTQGKTFEEAWEFVRERRSMVHPNSGF